MRKHLTKFLFVGSLLAATALQAQTWTTLMHAPAGGVGLCLLLTNANVMCQSGSSWYKLAPDANGNYQAGTWSSAASFPSGYNPDAFASAVLADGRIIAIGAEYLGSTFTLSNKGAIYDPVANTWTNLTPPSNIQFIGDAPATVLADGTFLVGSKLDKQLALLDPTTMTWSVPVESKKTDSFNSEEGWVILPDGSVFTLDVQNAPSAERYVPGTGWVPTAPTPVDLHTPTTSNPIQVPGGPVYYPPGEIGPTLLLNDGRVLAIGGTGQTAVYTPATNTWVLGPAVASGLNIEDGPGAVLPNGHVLFGASPGASGAGLKYYELDPNNLASLISVPAPARANSDATYYTSLLVLPTGQVLFVDGSTTVQLYTPAATPTNPAWAPTIDSTKLPTTINNGQTYSIIGTQFNGMTIGSEFGDESQNATNYPLVRITNNVTGHVFYARTHGHSSMGVQTGTLAVTTNFDVPASLEGGASTIQVVANGIPSAAVPVMVVSTNPAPMATSLTPNSGSGSGGTSVTITGSNFLSGATVTFGGAAGTVTSLTSTSIKVTTPAHTAGTVDVVVTNPDAQSATLSGAYTYKAAAPTIRSLSPNTGTRSGGTTVTISGANFVSGATVTFGGTAATVTSVTSTSIVVRTPAHFSGTVSVVVKNPDGQTATASNAYRFR